MGTNESQLSALDKAVLWKHGRLKYLLHSDQRMIYGQFYDWKTKSEQARQKGERAEGKFPRVFVLDCSRRHGKDHYGLTVMSQEAIRRPNALLTYATGLYRDATEICVDLFKKITEDCPLDLRPVYRDTFKGQGQGFYFPNGSIIKLVGIDKNPERLRGRASDGMCISEAAFCSDLEQTVSTVLLPQFLGRNHAFLLLNSTPSEQGLSHDWDTHFVPDAIERGAYVRRTIFDAPQYSTSEKLEFLKVKPENVDAVLSGDFTSIAPRERREYLCERLREPTRVVIPEFSRQAHVHEVAPPRYSHGYVSIDPAVKDLCAINFAVWDFHNAKLLILDEFTKRNANTNELADVIRNKERELFSNVHYWGTAGLQQNPFLRITDVDHRLIIDMKQLHGITCIPALKDDAEAALHALRNAFQYNQILIHPRCVNTIAHLEGAIWNKGRTSYERSERLGHADHVDALKYLWRQVSRTANPYPPPGFLAQQQVPTDRLALRPQHMETNRGILKKLESILPSRWPTRSRQTQN